ncbi:hypothetical protein cyc_07199 [Cyclospora cayetanensis]|uniref:Uncharacterized protein n=1 Tax=Cyclospora cayetanensis TaxID=88456 RepID=A0A1D3D9T5_9EIME|nr:hypothetical protein cyc_07199 [Cyclospora cayetanensis]
MRTRCGLKSTFLAVAALLWAEAPSCLAVRLGLAPTHHESQSLVAPFGSDAEGEAEISGHEDEVEMDIGEQADSSAFFGDGESFVEAQVAVGKGDIPEKAKRVLGIEDPSRGKKPPKQDKKGRARKSFGIGGGGGGQSS